MRYYHETSSGQSRLLGPLQWLAQYAMRRRSATAADPAARRSSTTTTRSARLTNWQAIAWRAPAAAEGLVQQRAALTSRRVRDSHGRRSFGVSRAARAPTVPEPRTDKQMRSQWALWDSSKARGCGRCGCARAQTKSAALQANPARPGMGHDKPDRFRGGAELRLGRDLHMKVTEFMPFCYRACFPGRSSPAAWEKARRFLGAEGLVKSSNSVTPP